MGDIADLYDEEYFDHYDRQAPTCKRCGKTPLHWLPYPKPNGSSGWRLYSPDGSLHTCRPEPKDCFEEC